MSKTAFSTKVRILATLWMYYREETEANEGWQQFFASQDLGFPLAYSKFFEYIEINKSGEKFIEGTWDMLCEGLNIDKDAEYNDLDDIFNASSNEVVELSETDEDEEE